MRNFIIILSLMCAAISGKDALRKLDKSMCGDDYSYEDYCEYPGDILNDFPYDSEKMSERCIVYKEYKNCLIDFEKICPYSNYYRDSPQEDLETLNAFCNETSALFKALVEHGKCYNEFYQQFDEERYDKIRECKFNLQTEKYDLYYKIINDTTSEGIYRMLCLDDIAFIICFTDEISKDCGNSAKELMMQALKYNKMRYPLLCKFNVTMAESILNEFNFLSLDPQYSLQEFISLQENRTELGLIE